jgi:NMT1-like family
MGMATVRRFMAAGMLGAALALWAGVAQVGGQTFPKFLQENGTEEAVRQRQNQWTLVLSGGSMGTTYLRFADELAKVLDDGDDLRVLPFISRGAASNLQDLLYLRGVDVTFTQSDVFEYFRTQRKVPNIENRVQYIIRLPVAELHVTARADIRALEDLRGQKVVFGGPGTASTVTGPIVFQRLGIEVDPLFVDHAAGLKMLMDGEAAGVLGVDSKPVDFWLKIPPNAGLHLLPVPFSRVLADLYVLGDFTNADYPNLIQPGQRIDTIAVPSVMATLNQPKSGDRYRRIERFTQYLFNRWDRIIQPPFHPRWRDVNLAATVPGWTRFSVSEEMLRRIAQGPASDQPPSFQDFQAYVNREVRTPPRNEAERDAVFRQFLIWREQQRKP